MMSQIDMSELPWKLCSHDAVHRRDIAIGTRPSIRYPWRDAPDIEAVATTGTSHRP
jgi:hypothetical protein